jgi:arabinan endo-1,5-alpha-L-arabinosidase
MRHRRALGALTAVLALVPTGTGPAVAHSPGTGRYTNPVSASFADTFADPMVIRGQDGHWYAYATSDPLREGEKTPHRIPTARSDDLVHWTYAGDAFGADQLPPYAAPGAMLWAPDVRHLDGRYVMYFTVTDTTVSADTFDTAVGAATAPTPTGPWTFAPEPVVAPRPGGGGGYLWTIDPAYLRAADGHQYLYYGSYYGGVSVTELSADGLRAVGSPTMVAIDNKFEGGYVVRRGPWYYLFASSANCCAGPTTGYSVSVGRSKSPRGPFTDREGVRLDVSRAGGTPVVAPNGNRWVGTGHNGLVTDLAGQDWLVYHAIDRADPFLDEAYGVNERPMLIDRLDWVDGWPTVRGGAGASESAEQAPVTTAGGAVPRRPRKPVADPAPGAPLPAYSEEFDGTAPGPAWTWVRQDPAATVGGGSLNWPVQGTDLVGAGNTAGVLLREAPTGDYLVETEVSLDLGEDTVRNYQQAGLVAYADDDRFARLSQVAIWNTRQVEFGYEMPFADRLSYGGTIVGPPARTTRLRLAHRIDPVNGEHEFRAGSSRDGKVWTWGGVWTFPAGTTPRIGLVAHGGAQPAVTASFGYVRFYALR